jgi:hypothetical protein
MTENDIYFIKDNQVFLKANKWFAERPIGELREANHQNTIASMEERFSESVEKVNEIKKDFASTDDIIKLAGKVSRTKNYLCNTKAIGNYTSLFEELDILEAAIKVAVDENLAKKEALCIEAEALLEAKEWKAGTEKLREILNQYKELAIVPDLKNEELKDRIEKAKDSFFKLKQAKYESFENDLLDNLSQKIDLCEKAESMKESSEWKKTTEEYQALNEEWKKIGMVPKHRMDEIWLRFNAAKDVFFARKKEHFGDIKNEQEENLTKKLALVEQAESLKNSQEWKKTTDLFTALMDEWKKIGRVPQEKSDEIWNQFLAAKNHFYQNKDGHYGNIRVQLEDNYAKKMSIVNRAEELQNTMDFENATQEYMELFEDWKKIGRIPKEHGDEPWERFLKAKKNFFDRKDADRNQRRAENNKDAAERVAKNRSFYNKISRELQQEEDLLIDVQQRMEELPPTLRSYEKRDEYLETIETLKKKIEELKAKCKELKDKLNQDERTMGGPRNFNRSNNGDRPQQERRSNPKRDENEASHEDILNHQKQHEEVKIEMPEVEISAEEALKNLMNKYKK